MKRFLIALGLSASLVATPLIAQVTIPQVPQINANDLFQDIVGGVPTPNSQYASVPLVGNLAFTQYGAAVGNALVGGDFGTNLFQRGTSVVLASPAAEAYESADRWAVWGGTNTPVTTSQQTGSTDIVANSTASFRVNKASGAGVVPVCIAQEVESANSTQFQGQTAEFSFYAKAGSTFSAANSALNAYITYGTGTDDGMQKLAYTVNAGGGGSTAWAGGANAAAVTATLSSGGFNRYTVTANIPATATEIGVTLCYTPVGTGTSTDWFEIALAQLDINPAFTSRTVTGGSIFTNDVRAKAFMARPQAIETALQQRYFYNLAEPAAGVVVATGVLTSTTQCSLGIPLPVPMRAVPTLGTTGTLSTSTWQIQETTTSTLASSSFIAALTAASTTTVMGWNAKLTTASTAGWACQLQGAGGTSSLTASAEL